jgi:hypothetical protein
MKRQALQLTLVLCFYCSVMSGVAAEGHSAHLAPSDGDSSGELLIFPDFYSVSRIDQGPKHVLNDNQVIPELNVFYTGEYQQFRFLGEWLVNSISHNVERIQFGVHLGEPSLWLGRFHNPIGYWNMQFHHAAFLQTSVSRPGIMAFETAGGVIPNHLTGFLLEGLHEFGESGLYYTIGAGAGPHLIKGLTAFNVFEPSGSHRPAASFRLGYQPVSYGIEEMGLSGAYTEIPGDHLVLNKVNQFVASIYANRQFGAIRFLSEALYVNNHLDRPSQGKTDSNFLNAYAQLEWDVSENITLYSRGEDTFFGRNDPYLSYFPKFVEDRIMGGGRYKFNQNMAFKLEVSQEHLRNDRFAQVMVQWSAIFP